MSVPARKVIKLRDPAQVDLLPLEEDPRFRKAREELHAIEKRIAKSEQRLQVAIARNRGQVSTRPVEARAKDLVAGGQIVVLPPSAEMEAAQEELTVLNQARIVQCEALERARSEISLEVCKRFAPLMEDSLRAVLSALTELHQGLEVGRVVRARIVGAGYQLNEAGIPTPSFPGAHSLSVPGDPSERSMSPAGRLRAWLEAHGML